MSQHSDYYELSNQTFAAVSGRVFEARLLLDDKLPQSALAMSLSPPTKGKQPVLDANLVLAANEGCEPLDFPAAVAGNVALVSGTWCSPAG